MSADAPRHRDLLTRERDAFYERQRARVSKIDALSVLGITTFMMIALRDHPGVFIWAAVVVSQVLAGVVAVRVSEATRSRTTALPTWVPWAVSWWVRGSSLSWAVLPLVIFPAVASFETAAVLTFFVIFGLASDAIYLPQTYPEHLLVVSAAYCLPSCVVLGYHGHWVAIAAIVGVLVHVTAASAGLTEIVDDLIRRRLDAADKERAALHTALTDPLTGLWNRAGILHELDTLIARDPYELVSVLFIDLDDFKSVNDRYGYAAGDTLLQDFAHALRSVLPPKWTVGRFGGDEFVAIGPGSMGVEIANAITTLALTPPDAGNSVIRASVGASVRSPRGINSLGLLHDAGSAVREAKLAAKNTVAISSPELRHKLHRRSAIERDVQSALENGEFVALAQPKVSLTSSTIVGVELLARWERDGEMVSPVEFIPMVSRLGLDHEFDMYMIEKGLELLENLPAGLTHLQVSVNVSTQRLSSPRFLEDLAAALDRRQVAPSQLTIEVTESDDLLLDRDTLELIAEIVDLGPRLSLDDFGTGYSSITRLVAIPFSEMKLDLSLVQRLKDPESYDLIRTLAGFAGRHGLDVVAEGVETEWQAGQLRGIGIPYGQGYHYGKPMPIDQLVVLSLAETVLLDTAA